MLGQKVTEEVLLVGCMSVLVFTGAVNCTCIHGYVETYRRNRKTRCCGRVLQGETHLPGCLAVSAGQQQCRRSYHLTWE